MYTYTYICNILDIYIYIRYRYIDIYIYYICIYICQNTKVFLTFSGDIEMEHWTKVG